MTGPLPFGALLTSIDALPVVLHRLPRATAPDLAVIAARLRHAADRIEAVAACVEDDTLASNVTRLPTCLRVLSKGGSR